jgi:hypothetical protein
MGEGHRQSPVPVKGVWHFQIKQRHQKQTPSAYNGNWNIFSLACRLWELI